MAPVSRVSGRRDPDPIRHALFTSNTPRALFGFYLIGDGADRVVDFCAQINRRPNRHWSNVAQRRSMKGASGRA